MKNSELGEQRHYKLVNKPVKTAVSFIVPAYNEAHVIPECLHSISQFLSAIAHEVIVVNNGSTDSTADIVSAHSNVRLISIERSTISHARNIGAEAANSPILAFVDADVVLTERWAAALRTKLGEKEANADAPYLGGFPYGVRNDASLVESAWFKTLLMSEPKYLSGGNIIVSKQLFFLIKGFDTTLITGEDVDFCHRAVTTGVDIDFDPSYGAIHLGYPHNTSSFFKREAWHGIGDFKNFATFRQSNIAISALLFSFCFIAAVLAGLLRLNGLGWLFVFLHLTIPLAFVIHKFRLRNGRYLAIQYGLAYIYLVARSYSLFRALSQRK